MAYNMEGCLLAPGRLEYQYTKKTNDD